MRQAIIRRKLEDGSIEETYIDLPSNDKQVSSKKKQKRKHMNEDNQKQEEEQTTPTSKAVVEITRSEG